MSNAGRGGSDGHETAHVPARMSRNSRSDVIGRSVDDLLAGRAVEPKAPYRDRRNEQKLKQRTDEHELRKMVAACVYIATAVQVAVADIAFYLYAWLGRDWDVPTQAISVWLGATVVQVIAVLLVITRYLFPSRQKK